MNTFDVVLAVCCVCAAQALPSHDSAYSLMGVPDLDTYSKISYPKYDLIPLGEYSKGHLPPTEIKISTYEKETVPEPYPVKVPVPHPYPVHVPKPYPVVETKIVKVPFPVPQIVEKKVAVPVEVPKPYPVPVQESHSGGGDQGGYDSHSGGDLGYQSLGTSGVGGGDGYLKGYQEGSDYERKDEGLGGEEQESEHS